MFKRALAADLISIFGVKKVKFASLETAGEQKVLYVDVTNVKPTIRDGKESARVSATLGIAGTLEDNPSGFFLKRIMKANANLIKRFAFDRTETPIDNGVFDWELKANSLSFIYFYEEEYNPPKNLLEYVKDMITIIFKGDE